MMMQINPSLFQGIVTSQSIPPHLKDYVSVRNDNKKTKFVFENVEITCGQHEYVYISTYDFLFKNVTVRNLCYEKELESDIVKNPVIQLTDCTCDSVEIAGDTNLFVSVFGNNKIHEIRINGQIQELYIMSQTETTINSILISSDLGMIDKNKITRLELLSNVSNALLIDTLRIEDVPVYIGTQKATIKNLQIDCELKSVLNFANDSIERLQLLKFNGSISARVSKIGFFDFPHNTTESSIYNFRSSSFDVFLINSAGDFGNTLFEQGCEIGKLILKSGKGRAIHINGCKIDVLYWNVSYFNFEELVISSQSEFLTHVNHLIFSGGVFNKKMKMEDFSFSRISFYSLINKGDIYVSDLRYEELVDVNGPRLIDFNEVLSPYWITTNPGGDSDKKSKYRVVVDTSIVKAFEILSSDLGKINFISCDFSEMRLVFKGSKIVEIFLSGTEMPEEMDGSYKERQVGYAQLKKVYDNRGDSVKSNEYLAKELDAHFFSLEKSNYKRKNFVTTDRPWSHTFDRCTLWLHKHSNHFGTSWKITLWWILVASLPLYMGYAWSIGYTPTWPWREDAMFYGWEISSFFLEFLFPIHKADFIPEALKVEPNSFSRILESLGRLLNGYIIYQFVAAFRKYGKK